MKLTDMLGADISLGDKVALALPMTVGEVVAVDSGDIALAGGAPRIPTIVVQFTLTVSSQNGIFNGIVKPCEVRK